MAVMVALSILAAPLGTAPVMAPATGGSRTRVSVSARATVRILPGVRVSLGPQAQAEGYRLNVAMITDVDGRRRPAKLVEFQ